jgi:hypothetical protein
MSTVGSKQSPGLAQVLHAVGCLLGTAGLLSFIVFAIGVGLPPLAAMNLSFVALAVMLIGFLLAWWNDLIGGVVSLAGITCFQILEIDANGRPAGGMFCLLFVPGAVSVLAWLLKGPLTKRNS